MNSTMMATKGVSSVTCYMRIRKTCNVGKALGDSCAKPLFISTMNWHYFSVSFWWKHNEVMLPLKFAIDGLRPDSGWVSRLGPHDDEHKTSASNTWLNPSFAALPQASAFPLRAFPYSFPPQGLKPTDVSLMLLCLCLVYLFNCLYRFHFSFFLDDCLRNLVSETGMFDMDAASTGASTGPWSFLCLRLLDRLIRWSIWYPHDSK